MHSQLIFSTVLVISMFVIINDVVVKSELFTSVSDLTKITVTHKSIVSILENHIILEENRLRRLRDLKQIYLEHSNHAKSERTHLQMHETSQHKLNSNQSVNTRIVHPVNAYVTVKQLTKGIDQIYHLLIDEANENSQLTKAKMDEIEKSDSLPNEDDYHGVSDAIFRLQTCYKLDTHHLTQGRLIGKYKGIMGISTYRKYTDEIGAQLDFEDCFSLGQEAYRKEDFAKAVEWFEEALLLFRKHNTKNDLQKSRTNLMNPSDKYFLFHDEPSLAENQILEYLAFSAFKRGQTKYAYEITLQWLELAPNETKAKDNLAYYISILEGNDSFNNNSRFPEDSISLIGDAGGDEVPKDKLAANAYIGLMNHLNLSSEDEITQALCRDENIYPKSLMIQNLKCYTTPANKRLRNVEMLNYKSELLYTSPHIIRIYNFLTDEESHHIKTISKLKLERSTVHTSDGQRTSDFRIAKTAWLDAKDRLVSRIEKRISDILDLRLEEAEYLQVVNYGLGGFYGAHFDFARSESMGQRINSGVSGLARNDRLVTFLMYISHVEAGGATVFPQLGVTVKPIKNSAVVWYNIHKNGLGDRRTKHAGCPVLYGSKWIATKWLRENANTFVRPCSLNQSD